MIIFETAPPGMEDWVKSNKQRFIDEYGEERGTRVLYAKAWTMKNKKLREQYMKEDDGPTNQMANSDGEGTGSGGAVEYTPPLLGIKGNKDKKGRVLKRLMSQIDGLKKRKSQLTR